MAPHHDEENKPTADFIEYPDPDKDHGALPTPQKGVDEEQAALYREFESKDEEWHHYMQKKLMRKVDWHLLPLLILMYLLNFLDRSNLAQARLGTLEEDLNMKGTDYNLATSILFVGYLLMQLPSNLLLTRIRPSMYLGTVMGIWGAISAAQAAAHSFGGLVAARFMLGYAQWRLLDDTGEADHAGASTVMEGVKLALKDPRLYIFTLLQHLSLLTQTFQYFFPTVIETLGYGKIETLLITAPVWILTFLVGLLVTWTSGKTGDRSYHIMCLSMISCVGNIICISTLNIPARFFAIFLMPMGAVAGYQIIITWVANSFPRPLVKRSACISFANMIGNSANIYGPYMYPKTDTPRYIPGGSATAATALAVTLLAFAIRLLLARDNRKMEERELADAEGVAEHAENFGVGLYNVTDYVVAYAPY
ncbi:putative major facilitator superfamily transporter protein [Neofusicoccum parvum UCRNP2]|uniref:Putative major facilitator superfamily transporter protein n=1 Tax=Botryosphaeria parva (strain UCR-NP2) TaxID=1287680 RepID=R1GR26_BOTPV|nr:putative major facilitator superfamily transporter protein [Neofusicoccum parvum UCRNP2]